MKARYIGDYYRVSLKKGKIYEVTARVDGFLCMIDETGESYAFPEEDFEIIEE